jgi:hypothetical protein
VQIIPSAGGVVPIDDEDAVERLIEADSIKKWEQQSFHNTEGAWE